MQLPNEEIMKQMAKLAMEQSTTYFAKMAREFAARPEMSQASARQALNAFANAIESSNAKVWPISSESFRG